MTHFSLSNSSLVVTAFFNNCMSNVQKNDILNVIELKKLKKKKKALSQILLYFFVTETNCRKYPPQNEMPK